MFTTLGRCKPKTKRCDKEVCDNHKYDYHMDETHFNIKGLKRISFPSPPEVETVRKTMATVGKEFRKYGDPGVICARLRKEVDVMERMYDKAVEQGIVASGKHEKLHEKKEKPIKGDFKVNDKLALLSN